MNGLFFVKTKCDRCGGSLKDGRIMSMYNTDCICMKCKEEETKRPDYEEAVKKDLLEYQKRFTYKCCICGKMFTGYGNNPYPIKTEGRCCDECNKKVLEERIKLAVKNW